MAKRVRELYDDTFQETLRGNALVFVDFYADWCGPCKAVAPVVERIAKEYESRVVFGKLNIDGNPENANRLRVTTTPTVILFHEGKPVVRLNGFQPEPALRASLDPLCAACRRGSALRPRPEAAACCRGCSGASRYDASCRASEGRAA